MQTLADLVGVSAWQTVQQWEKEEGTAPKRERLAAVAKALRTTPEFLLFGENVGSEAALNAVLRTKRQQDWTLSMEAAAAGVSMTAMQLAHAFDSLDSPEKKEAILAQFKAFGILLTDDEGQHKNLK